MRDREQALLREVTGQRRGRVFRYDPYLRLFDDDTVPAASGGVPDATGHDGR